MCLIRVTISEVANEYANNDDVDAVLLCEYNESENCVRMQENETVLSNNLSIQIFGLLVKVKKGLVTLRKNDNFEPNRGSDRQKK